MGLTPKNWGQFQHYKDRLPPWIKLHRTLLDNHDYFALTPLAAKALPLIWLIASEKDGSLPVGAELAWRLRLSEQDAIRVLTDLCEHDFLVDTDDAEQLEQVATTAQQRAVQNGFGNRYIPDTTRRLVWERDGGKCCQCGSESEIEYDHKIPVSKGGNSEQDNLQLLCRSCNRRKRVKLATQALGRCSLETEAQEEKITEIDVRTSISRAVSTETRTDTNFSFEEFWKAYPKREGANPKVPARKAFIAAIKAGATDLEIIAAASRYRIHPATKVGTPFVTQAVTWLHQKRWTDYPEPAATPKNGGGYYARPESPQIEAWDAHRKATTGMSYPRDANGGWTFPSEWPPGHESVPRETASCEA